MELNAIQAIHKTLVSNNSENAVTNALCSSKEDREWKRMNISNFGSILESIPFTLYKGDNCRNEKLEKLLHFYFLYPFAHSLHKISVKPRDG